MVVKLKSASFAHKLSETKEPESHFPTEKDITSQNNKKGLYAVKIHCFLMVVLKLQGIRLKLTLNKIYSINKLTITIS